LGWEDGLFRVGSNLDGVGDEGAGVGVTEGWDGIGIRAVSASEWLRADGLQDGANL